MRQVVYIAGMSRSGSTLLARMLGQVPSFVFAGEMQVLWQDATKRRDRLCGCGELVRRCAFWSHVLTVAYGDDATERLEGLARSTRRFARLRHLPLLRWSRLQRSTLRHHVKTYAASVAPLLDVVLDVADAEVLVDSGKSPVYALAWAQLPEVRVTMVHLVRDPRAVANSLSRQRRSPSVDDEPVYMTTVSADRAAIEWTVRNVLTELARSKQIGYVRVRYEDYVSDPEAVLRSVTTMVSSEPRTFDFLDGRSVNLGACHAIGGNPVRFDTGLVALTPDDGWKTELPRRSAVSVAVLTAPLTRRYGYRLCADRTGEGRSNRRRQPRSSAAIDSQTSRNR